MTLIWRSKLYCLSFFTKWETGGCWPNMGSKGFWELLYISSTYRELPLTFFFLDRKIFKFGWLCSLDGMWWICLGKIILNFTIRPCPQFWLISTPLVLGHHVHLLVSWVLTQEFVWLIWVINRAASLSLYWIHQIRKNKHPNPRP